MSILWSAGQIYLTLSLPDVNGFAIANYFFSCHWASKGRKNFGPWWVGISAMNDYSPTLAQEEFYLKSERKCPLV